ncbi:MAG: hypothetical protein RSF40_02075 [Oscillospiraceae bacterium]
MPITNTQYKKRDFFNFLQSYTCPICKKSFIPAPYHIYQVNEIPYCSYTCYRKKTNPKKPKLNAMVIEDIIKQNHIYRPAIATGLYITEADLDDYLYHGRQPTLKFIKNLALILETDYKNIYVMR